MNFTHTPNPFFQLQRVTRVGREVLKTATDHEKRSEGHNADYKSKLHTCSIWSSDLTRCRLIVLAVGGTVDPSTTSPRTGIRGVLSAEARPYVVGARFYHFPKEAVTGECALRSLPQRATVSRQVAQLFRAHQEKIPLFGLETIENRTTRKSNKKAKRQKRETLTKPST